MAGGSGRRNAAKIVYVSVALLIAGGLCTLRVSQMQEERDEEVRLALDAIADAVTASGGERASRFDAAREAALCAARSSTILLDPYATFLVTAVERLQASLDASAPGAEAPATVRATWLIARGDVVQAHLLLSQALDAAHGSSAVEGELRTWHRLSGDLVDRVDAD